MSSIRTEAAPATAQTRIPSRTMAALFTALRGSIGTFSLIDMSLPRGHSASVEREAVFGYCADFLPVEQQFLSSFRQSGGHRETYMLPPNRKGHFALTNLLNSVDRSRKIVIFAESIEQAESLLDLAESGSLIVRVSSYRPIVVGRTMQSWLSKRRVIAFRSIGIGQTFLWFTPADDFEAIRGALLRTLTPEGRSAAIKNPSALERALRPDTSFALPITADAPLGVGLAASAMIHDGGYRSESDGDYSWLWTGPSHHFRVLLTGAPHIPAKLNVSVIKTEDARNLASLKVLIDGRHVRHRFQPWSDLSGKVTIDLGAPTGDMTILSLVCPHMVMDSAGHRNLGLCIDKIEMIP